MGIYLFTILILFLFSINEIISENQKLKDQFLFVSFLLLVFVIGFRWETGTDWNNYLNTFKYANIAIKENIPNTMEYSFLLFNYIVRSFTANYTIFLVLQAIIYYSIIIIVLRKMTKFTQTTLFLLFSSTLGYVGANRQLLAIAICFLGLNFLIDRKYKYFWGNIIIASTIHISAYIFGLYSVFNRRINSVYLISSVMLSYILGKFNISLYILKIIATFNDRIASKVNSYTLNEFNDLDLSLLGLVRRFLFLFLFIGFRDQISLKMKNYNLLLNGYTFSVILYFLFKDTFMIFVSRGSVYFLIMEPLLLASILHVFKTRGDKVIFTFFLLLLSLLLMYQSIAAYSDLFEPYKGIFFNTDFKRKLY